MAIHQLFDLQVNRDDIPCGLCLSTGSKCAIRLTKGKGRNGATRIDLKKSRCPNLLRIMFATASKFNLKSPCTNVPIQCPLCRDEADAVWKYNLESHITTVHPTAKLDLYSDLYEISRGEHIGLKTLSQIKERSTALKSRNLEDVNISEEHTTQFAFRNFRYSFTAHLNTNKLTQVPHNRTIAGDETLESEEDKLEEDPGVSANVSRAVSEEVTENASGVRLAEDDMAEQTLGEMDAVIDNLPTGRRKRILKRRPECDYDDSDHCAESDCEDSQRTEITCTGPACGRKVRSRPSSICIYALTVIYVPQYHLVYVALSVVPEGGWFCDEDCRENAGFRRRGVKKTRKRARVIE